MLGNQLLAYMNNFGGIFPTPSKEYISLVKPGILLSSRTQFLLRMVKCEFLKSKITYLAYFISQANICMQPDKISAIRDYTVTCTVKHVMQFLGMIGYYRRYIFPFAPKVSPLTDLLKRDVCSYGTRQARLF